METKILVGKPERRKLIIFFVKTLIFNLICVVIFRGTPGCYAAR